MEDKFSYWRICYGLLMHLLSRAQQEGNISLVEISLRWFAAFAWRCGEWSHLLIYGEYTWISVSAKGMD